MSRGALVSGCAAIVAIAVVLVLGFVTTPSGPPIVSTDTLGPDGAEPIAQYLARADDSLSAVSGGSDELWALVSFRESIPVDRVRAAVGGLRVSEVMFRLPLPQVQTPLIVQKIGDGDAALAAAGGLAISQAQLWEPVGERPTAIRDATVRGLERGCACVVGVLVRGAVPQLHAARQHESVRAVEGLPADAVYRRFAVRPLLPEFGEFAVAGPDDGQVPQ